ncbi:MAG: MlaE family ABC transporter permease [Bacteroidales bacterium]|jgi:phospholipid/cholesterol/gamma-HCH transport system permease protein|nr:ABC transporter permease [Bacteroidales bacterium]
MKYLQNIGSYLLLMRRVFKRPQQMSVFRKQIWHEMEVLGYESIGFVVLISVFMGAVVTIQTAFQIESPLVPNWTVGFTVRQSVILEFSPTIISLFLAGKVGSRIASEIGTMRVTEQIDALEVMGINSATHLILPKVVAFVLINPVLVVFSIFTSIFGGWLAAINTKLVSSSNYIEGIIIYFEAFDVSYAMIKTIVFAFIITTISGFYGYKTEGGALEVGRSSTNAVVYSSIVLLFFNMILTQLLLA